MTSAQGVTVLLIGVGLFALALWFLVKIERHSLALTLSGISMSLGFVLIVLGGVNTSNDYKADCAARGGVVVSDHRCIDRSAVIEVSP